MSSVNGQPFDGLIFDCDGTLADTMPAHYEAWIATLTPLGVTMDEDHFYAMGGWPTRQVATHLLEQQGITASVEQIALDKEAAFVANLAATKPIEQVVAIAAAHRGKIPMAVATGGMRRVAERILSHLGILDWFDAVVTCDDVVKHKPEPDIFLEAARRLGVRPERCQAYEDTEPGLESARRAGMTVVDVRTLYTIRRITPLKATPPRM